MGRNTPVARGAAARHNIGIKETNTCRLLAFQVSLTQSGSVVEIFSRTNVTEYVVGTLKIKCRRYGLKILEIRAFTNLCIYIHTSLVYRIQTLKFRICIRILVHLITLV